MGGNTNIMDEPRMPPDDDNDEVVGDEGVGKRVMRVRVSGWMSCHTNIMEEPRMPPNDDNDDEGKGDEGVGKRVGVGDESVGEWGDGRKYEHHGGAQDAT